MAATPSSSQRQPSAEEPSAQDAGAATTGASDSNAVALATNAGAPAAKPALSSAPKSLATWVLQFHDFFDCLSFFVHDNLTVSAYFLLAFIYFLPTPRFFDGILWGIFFVYLALKYSLAVLFPLDQKSSKHLEESPATIDDKSVKQMVENTEKIVYKGWMNYLHGDYDPSKYTLSLTHSVLVRLDSDVLRLSVPKKNKPKHSSCDEAADESVFIDQEMYSIAGARVVLRPKLLTSRRWFSRKYPICIYLCHLKSNGQSAKSDTEESSSEKSHSEGPNEEDLLIKQPVFNAKHVKTTLTVSASEPQLNKNAHKVVGTRRKFFSASAEKLYLFARSAREKEHWFHRLRMATGQHVYKISRMKVADDERKTAASENESSKSTMNQHMLNLILYAGGQKQFSDNMKLAGVYDKAVASSLQFNMQLNHQSWTSSHKLNEKLDACKENIVWFNALFTRIFMVCSKDPFWIKTLMDVVEMKLSTIKLPYFIETLKMSKLDPGKSVPKITGIYEPYIDEWGLWIDMDIEYFGDVCLALETKINLMKLKSEKCASKTNLEKENMQYCNANMPNSPESSEDEADRCANIFLKDENPKEKLVHKLINQVEKLRHTRYFQALTENALIKQKMQEISNTPIILLVDFKILKGTLAVNIAAPPSDRLWYGFRHKPNISLKARPKLGDRSVRLNQVIEWIEHKMVSVFEKNLVIPNMDDISLRLIAGSPLLKDINV